MRARVSCLLLPLLAAGCAVGPNYKRPAVQAPGQFRGAPAGGSAASLADEKWFDLFQDETLKQLVTTALKTTSIWASLRSVCCRRAPGSGSAGPAVSSIGRPGAVHGLAAFLARIQHAGDAGHFARCQLHAGRSGARLGTGLLGPGPPLEGIGSGAISGHRRRPARRRGIADQRRRRGYFTLREADLELDIAGRTRDIAAQNLKLVQLRHDRGAATGLDVHQAEQFLYTATAQIASAQRDVAQTENALSLLLGRLPVISPGGRRWRNSPSPPRFRRACHPPCWSGGLTYARLRRL